MKATRLPRARAHRQLRRGSAPRRWRAHDHRKSERGGERSATSGRHARHGLTINGGSDSADTIAAMQHLDDASACLAQPCCAKHYLDQVLAKKEFLKA